MRRIGAWLNCILHAERLGGARGLHRPVFFWLYICKTSAAYIARLRLYIYKNTQNSKVSLWRTAGDRKGRGRPFQGTSPAYIARFRLYIYVKKVRIVRIPSCSQPCRQEMICKTSAAYIARLCLYIYNNTQNSKVSLWRTAAGWGHPALPLSNPTVI